MNTKFLWSVSILGLLVAGCSSSDETAQTATSNEGGNTSGYIAVQQDQLPSANNSNNPDGSMSIQEYLEKQAAQTQPDKSAVKATNAEAGNWWSDKK